jgi:hypothetical protein
MQEKKMKWEPLLQTATANKERLRRGPISASGDGEQRIPALFAMAACGERFAVLPAECSNTQHTVTHNKNEFLWTGTWRWVARLGPR